MMGMTIAQRALRPVMRYIVERFFPDGAFFGRRFLRGLITDADLVRTWSSTEMACAMFLVSRMREEGATEATFEASDVTDGGAPVGSWRMTVQKI